MGLAKLLEIGNCFRRQRGESISNEHEDGLRSVFILSLPEDHQRLVRTVQKQQKATAYSADTDAVASLLIRSSSVDQRVVKPAEPRTSPMPRCRSAKPKGYHATPPAKDFFLKNVKKISCMLTVLS